MDIVEQPTRHNDDEGIASDYEEDMFKCSSILCDKMEFTTLMEAAIDPYIKSCMDRKKFDWGCVSKFFENYKTKLTHIYRLRIFCTFLLKLFADFDCLDITLIRKTIYMYHQIFQCYKLRFSACIRCRYAGSQKHFITEETFRTSTILENLNKKIPPCFYFDDRKFYSELTMDAIHEGDFVLLQFLVKYGLSYFPTDMRKHTSSILKPLIIKYHIMKANHNIINGREIEEQCNDILHLCTSNSEESKLRKLIMTIWTVNIALCKNFGDKYYPDYVQCLTLFAKTLPDSPVSLMDVENFLNFAFFDPFFINQMCSEVKEAFSGIESLPTPRPLKFLCRCKIRNCIGSKMFDPFASILSETNIASPIVKYLLIV